MADTFGKNVMYSLCIAHLLLDDTQVLIVADLTVGHHVRGRKIGLGVFGYVEGQISGVVSNLNGTLKDSPLMNRKKT